MRARPHVSEREFEIFDGHMAEVRQETDRLFVWLLSFQWFTAILITVLLTPYTWVGSESSVHPHVYLTVFFGGFLSLFPIIKILKDPGKIENGYIVCISQLIYTILLVHITGGRVESHFHVFGSLTFLGCYRNKKIIYLGTVIVVADHILRGLYFPMSIYGVPESSLWRAIEHTAWIIFLDIFLLMAIRNKTKMFLLIAQRECALERSIANTERMVKERTSELVETRKTILDQQQTLLKAERLSSLGQMAAEIAHEINNPMGIIATTTYLMRSKIEDGETNKDELLESLNDIEGTVNRVSKIIRGLKNVSRNAIDENVRAVPMKEIINDVVSISSDKFKAHSISFTYVDRGHEVYCRRVQISQVLLNLVTNAYDAVKDLSGERWVRIEVKQDPKWTHILVSNSGPSIPEETRMKIFQPFFTTKDLGKGTGLGLSLSQTIVENHGGIIELNTGIPFTQFDVRLPKFAA